MNLSLHSSAEASLNINSGTSKTQSQATSTASRHKATLTQTSRSLITKTPVYYSRHDRPRGWNVDSFGRALRFPVRHGSVWRWRGPSSVIRLCPCVQKAWAFSSLRALDKKAFSGIKETENWHFTVANIPLCDRGERHFVCGRFCTLKNNFAPRLVKSVWWISTANGWISAHYENERASLLWLTK